METIRRLTLRGLCGLVATACLTLFNPQAQSAEITFPVLQTKSGTYTNATVTTTSKKYIFIIHSTGMGNIKVQDLSRDTLKELGYAVPDEKPAKSNVVRARELIPQLSAKIKPLETDWQNQVQSELQKYNISQGEIWIWSGVMFFLYLINCYCCHLICIKAKSRSSILVLLPGFKMIPLFRAAGMSAWWFLPYILFPLTIIVWVVWSFNIAKARDKSVLTALLLAFPPTSGLAFLYLALSGAPEAAPIQKYKSMSLQTA